MDYDELRTGMRREAQYSNLMQLINWYMSVFSTSLPFVLLAALGFKSDVEQTVNRVLMLFNIAGKGPIWVERASQFSWVLLFVECFCLLVLSN